LNQRLPFAVDCGLLAVDQFTIFQSSRCVFSRKLLPTTDKELSAMAALANMGSINIPKAG
jgi:hypothetical protein